MLKMLGLTYYNIKMLKNDFFSGFAAGAALQPFTRLQDWRMWMSVCGKGISMPPWLSAS